MQRPPVVSFNRRFAGFTLSCLTVTALAGMFACTSSSAPVENAGAHKASAAPSSSAAPVVTAARPVVQGHSINIEAMDRNTKPGADFFMFANGSWYSKATIDSDRESTGAWLVLEKQIEGRTKELLEAAAKDAPKFSQLQKIGDYYASFVDEEGIEKKGLAPMKATFDRIAKIADAGSLSTYLGSQLRADVDPLNNTNFQTDHIFGLFVEQDLDDPSRTAPYILQGGLGMPDRSYYLENTPAMTEMRDKYVKHLTAMFKLAGSKDKDAEDKAKRVMALETKIATAHATRTESEDVHKAKNPWPTAEFEKRAPGIDWAKYMSAAQLSSQKTFYAWHPKAITGISALVKSEPIATWRDYLVSRELAHAAWMLPKAFVEEYANFHKKALKGVPELPPRWRRAMDATNDVLGEDVGRAYVAKWFPAESKKKLEEMVTNIVASFGKRIDSLSWMSPSTKAKAKEKLGTLKVGIGYPDKWRDDSKLNIVRGDVLGNYERAELFDYQQAIAKIGKPVDRGEWAMIPHIVNAVNLPVKNALNFPAGILAPPFFNPDSTPAANYGAIGAIIGHEISHSFDNEGAKFDAHGRVMDWWTPDDLSHFEASGKALIAQYNSYKPFPDLSVNGEQTLSENIADLAGLAAAWDAWQESLHGALPPSQDGLTGEQQFFLAFAQSWQTKMRDQALRNRIATNGHAPAQYRALTVRNLDAWYTAFDVKPEDPLYLAPEKRVRVW